ncbi:hypothetical protein [Flavobacterium sp.]|uniref:hypothetical protein n=2 Tax=Flavobacterium sp. TaxID=239 RepID=UPI004047F24A
MKRIYILFSLLLSLLCNGQIFYLQIEGSTEYENKIIDSINYNTKHKNISSLLKTIKSFDSTLTNQGYLEKRTTRQTKTNDSTFLFEYTLGKKTNYSYIYIGKNKELTNHKQDTLKIKFNKTEDWAKNTLNILEQNGYPLAKIKLSNQKHVKDILYSELTINLNKKRSFDEIITLGYPKFPKNIKQSLIRKLRKQNLNKKNIEILNNELNELTFANQIKYPEILFTKDSTKIYTYLEKAKPNKFEGFIGFANDKENKPTLNGYLDLNLQNTFNSAEKINLYWKNDGNKQTVFNFSTEFPYIFKTSIGIKSSLRIFKQDSTFQNTQSELQLGYYFNVNKKTLFGLQNTTSTDTQTTTNNSIESYKSKFYTLSYEYAKPNRNSLLIKNNTEIRIKTGSGERTSNEKTTKQFFCEFNLEQNITLNTKNKLFLKSQTFYLNSNNHISNELYRFGGINSIRGFRENSLQANLFTSIITEYRHILNQSLYIHSIIDYGYFEDNTTKTKNNLFSFGCGLALLTNNGVFNLIYANGSTKNQTIKLSNSIIHISFKTNF